MSPAPRAPDLGGFPAIPRDEEGPVFREPWEAQAFAIAVLLSAGGQFSWQEWSARLAAEIAAARARGEADDGRRYYRFWLSALEKLLADKQIVAADELRARREAWDAAARATPHGRPIALPSPESGS